MKTNLWRFQLTNDPVPNAFWLGWNLEHVEVEDASEDDVPPEVELVLLDLNLVEVYPLLEDLLGHRLGIPVTQPLQLGLLFGL